MCLLLFELAAVDFGVEVGGSEEGVVGAGGGDAAFLHDQDLVGIADGGKAVGDDEGGATLDEILEGKLDEMLGFGIDRSGGVVEDEDAGVHEQDAGNGDALFLSAGEGDAALTDAGVVALGAVEDEFVRLSGCGSADDLLICGTGGAEGDIFADGIGEEGGLLEDDADLGAEGVEGGAADVAAIDADETGGGVVKAGQEADDGGLAGAGGAEQGDDLTGLDGEVDIGEDFMLTVAEGNVLELDLAEGDGDGGGIRLVFDLGDRIEDVEDAFGGGTGDGDGGDDEAEPADGVDELADVSDEGDDFAEGDVSGDILLTAEEDDNDDAEVGDEKEEGHIEGLHAGGEGGETEPMVVFTLEASSFGFFLDIGFDLACTAQVLLDGGGQDGELLLDLEGKRAVTGAKLEGATDQEGHGEEDKDSQAIVHEEHSNGGGDEEQAAI